MKNFIKDWRNLVLSFFASQSDRIMKGVDFMLSIIIAYSVGALLGIGFTMLIWKASDTNTEEDYDRGYRDGINSVK